MTSATTKQVYVIHDFLHIKFMLCMILADFTLLMLENISHLLSFIYVIGWHYIILKSLEIKTGMFLLLLSQVYKTDGVKLGNEFRAVRV